MNETIPQHGTPLEPWNTGDGERTSLDILFASLGVIFICTWKSLHLNIPEPGTSTASRLLRKTLFFLLALLAPELIVTWAARDYMSATSTRQKLRPHFRFSDFTRAHAFFVNMGGFRVHLVSVSKHHHPHPPITCCIQTHNAVTEEVFACDGDVLLCLIEKGLVEPPMITEEEVLDRSKSDSLSYIAALWHIGWMLVLMVAQWSYHRPTPLIEWSALAFMSSGIATYGLLWYKPQDVVCAIPLHVDQDRFLELQDRPTGPGKESITSTLDRIAENTGQATFRRGGIRYATWTSGRHQWLLGLATIVFNGIHCAAWNYLFPTVYEQWLWRASCVVAIGSGMLLFGIAVGNYYLGAVEESTMAKASFYCSALLYLVSRVCLLILAIVSLRAVPAGVYKKPPWVIL